MTARNPLPVILLLGGAGLLSGQTPPAVPETVKLDRFVVSDASATPDVFRLERVEHSYVARGFADPLNTVTPPANGAVGLVPAYGLLDINATFKLRGHLTLRINLNNVTNRQYFTKRPLFYPGPGAWPSDGRSVNFTLGLKLSAVPRGAVGAGPFFRLTAVRPCATRSPCPEPNPSSSRACVFPMRVPMPLGRARRNCSGTSPPPARFGPRPANLACPTTGPGSS